MLGDGRDAIHCFERECSLQRRRQKVWEEAPSLALDRRTFARSSAPPPSRSPSRSTIAARARSNISTTTRRKVLFHRDEHPHPGRASGHRDGHRHRPGARDDPDRRRRAAALTAKDIRFVATRSRCASTPRIRRRTSALPRATSRRLARRAATACVSTRCSMPATQVPPFYDSLVGKLIVWDETREGALARCDRALGELIVEGIATTKPLHQALAEDPEGARRRVPYPLARGLARPAAKRSPSRRRQAADDQPIFLRRR